MFKKVLQSLSKSFGGKPGAPASAVAAAPAAPKSKEVAPAPTKTAPAATKSAAPAPVLSPEEKCGVTPKMTKSEIHAHLKLLYRRYNRGASSLDAKTRAEADDMLDAIVQVREKHFGEL